MVISDCEREPPVGVGVNKLEIDPRELERVPGAVPVLWPVGAAVVFDRGNGIPEPTGLVNEVVAVGMLPVLEFMLVGAVENTIELVVG